MALETRDVVVPEPSVLFGPLRDFLNPVGLELVDTLAAFLSLPNEPRASQNAEMLRDRGSRHAKA